MNRGKDKNLILYICHKFSSDPSFGSTKLNKALYFIDITAFLKRGSYISSFEYVKQDQGPTPEASSFLTLKEELIESGFLKEIERDYFGYRQKRPVAIGPASMGDFTGEEVEIIDEIIEDIKGSSASELSSLTHNIGWKVTPKFQVMKPKTFFVTNEPLLPNEVLYFESLIAG